MLRARLVVTGVVLATACASCASSSERDGFKQTEPAATEPAVEPPTAATSVAGNLPKPPDTEPEDNEINEVYGQSRTTLYKLDPKTKQVSVVGDFQNCGGDIIDIALDAKGALFGVSNTVLYAIDKSSAKCTAITTAPPNGKFPNSLSFVPKGTVDPNVEALVGYDGGDYVRIAVDTGERSVIGHLGAGNLESSGDIVSVKDGATYLTVKGGACNTNDCLVEVDPSSGKLLKNWGSIEHKKVFGLSFWGGKVYGFDNAGNLFEVSFGVSQLSTQPIDIPQRPTGLSFWGAGSSTSAPLVSEPR